MKRVSNVDGSFFLSETSTTHMHVIGTIVLDAAHMAGGYDFDVLVKLFDDRLHLLPSFRRRAVQVPFKLGQPVWIEDPDFDLHNHLHRAAVPAPGSLHELAEFVGDYASRPLERDKPLWEAALVEGLEGGRVAIVTKLHHAMMDGGAGAELLGVLFSLKPEEDGVSPPEEPWVPEPVPSAVELMGRALREQAGKPGQALSALATVGQSLVSSLFSSRPTEEAAEGPSEPGLFSAPRTSFNAALSPHRAVGFASCELAELKRIGKALDAKVNDVVLAACTSALRGYLTARDELPDMPLVASVPIALAIGDGDDDGNHVSMMLIPLPVQLADPIERLELIAAATKRGKREHDRAGGDVVQRFADIATALATPRFLSGLMELYSSSHIADHLPPMWNVVISNIAGPPVPLYCAGARVEAIYPMGPVLDGCGLNFTVLSNAGEMDIGIMACRELVTGVEGLGERVVDGVAELCDALARRTEGAE